jgi:hypothetical protein
MRGSARCFLLLSELRRVHWMRRIDVQEVIMTKFFGYCAVSAAALCFSGTVQAATLEAVKPGVTVSVNGAAFSAVTGAIEVGAGDIVKVAAGSVAKIAYAGQCLISIQSGATYVVAAKAPCPASYSVNQAALPPVPPVEAPVPPAPAAAASGLGPLGIGAVVAGVVGVAAAVVVSAKSSSP